MNSVFVIQNQQGQFLSRHKEWVDNTQIQAVYKTPHRDLAVNEWVELTARDIAARARVVAVDTTSKGLPLLSTLPPLEFPGATLPDDLVPRDHPDDGVTAEAAATAAAGSEPEPAQLEKDAFGTDIRHVS
jgi:hypothetical protein